VIGFVAVSALGGTKLASYIRSEIREARERAESNIPPEKELARLRNEIKELDRDIVKTIGQLAEQNVAVDNLKAKNAELAKSQEAALKSLKLRGEALKAREEQIRNAQGHVTFGNRTVNIADATKELDGDKAALEQDVKSYKAAQKLLETQQATLGSRVKVRDGVKQNLEAMQAQKGELAAAVDELEAQLVALKADGYRRV
jgi:chromosome segregation ATPase